MFNGAHDRPATGAFLTSFIHNEIDDIFACFWILLLENIGSDFDEKRFKITIVPIGKNISKFLVGESCSFKNVVCLADELHVAVFNSVVDHLHEVTCATLTDVDDAWLTVDFGGYTLEDWFHDFPCAFRSAWHDGWTFEGAFFATRYSSTDETHSCFGTVFVAALCIGIE